MAKESKNSKERKRLYQIYNRLYEMHYSESSSKGCCFYCGEPASTIDHCPPLTWIEAMTVNEWLKAKIPLVKIHSCSDCNKVLGTKPIFTLYERAAYLEKDFLNKYEKQSTLWSNDEIKEMSYMFQLQIKGKIEKAKILLVRARNLQNRLSRPDSFPGV
jgi:hypothetical protein